MKKLTETTVATLPNWEDKFPGLTRQTTRHGKEVWYVRPKHHGERIRIRAPYGTDDFQREYDAAVTHGEKSPGLKQVEDIKSLAWLITEYRKLTAWLSLGDETRYQREYYLQIAQAKSGHEKYRDVTRKSVVAGRDAHQGASARHFVDTMRGLFKWAVDVEKIPADPSAGVSYPKRKKSSGFPTWTEEEIAHYERSYPLGTKERVWMAVLQFLGGPRRGDAVALGKQHVQRAPQGSPHRLEVVFKTEKSQGLTEVTIPMLPDFMEVIAAGPIGELTFIVGDNGRPITKETFGNYFREACMAIGITKRAHGVRKRMAARMADRGASENTLMATFGWTDPRMPSVYTQAANKKGLSRANVDLLAPPSDSETELLTVDLDAELKQNKLGPPSPSKGEGETSGKLKRIK